MEFMAGACTVWVARVRPSGRVREVNSTSAERRGVKSPLRIALTRCHRPAGRTRLTVPCATVPAGTTSRSKAKTGSITFASTGAPRRLGRRRVKYTRNGAPGGTWIEIFRLSSSAAGTAEMEMHAARKPRAIPIAHLLGLIISPAGRAGAGTEGRGEMMSDLRSDGQARRPGLQKQQLRHVGGLTIHRDGDYQMAAPLEPSGQSHVRLVESGVGALRSGISDAGVDIADPDADAGLGGAADSGGVKNQVRARSQIDGNQGAIAGGAALSSIGVGLAVGHLGRGGPCPLRFAVYSPGAVGAIIAVPVNVAPPPALALALTTVTVATPVATPLGTSQFT